MAPSQSTEAGFIVIGQLKIDFPARCAWLADQLVSLSPLEFAALVCLARHAGQFLSPSNLLREVWGYRQGGTHNQVHLCLKRLRRKLTALNQDDSPYITRNYGCYRMVTDAEWHARKRPSDNGTNL